jgi:hypothetical protein
MAALLYAVLRPVDSGPSFQGIAVTNNHLNGQAAVNALEIASYLSGEQVDVPEPLAATRPGASSRAVTLPGFVFASRAASLPHEISSASVMAPRCSRTCSTYGRGSRRQHRAF